MSEHKAIVEWKLDGKEFSLKTYSRNHTWNFPEKGDAASKEFPASAAPAFLGDPACVNPEEALVAAISSCHMLTFLAIAAKKRWVIESYTDEASGYLEKNPEGAVAITRTILRPNIVWGGDTPPAAELDDAHHLAHKQCFIAQSVKTDISIEPV